MQRTSKTGFTLIEMLTVISTIGVLAGMLLPAVNSAREAGRRSVCINNVKNVTLAANLYHESRGKYPQYNQTLRSQVRWTATLNDYSVTVGWIPILFPFLEQSAVWDNMMNPPLDSLVVTTGGRLSMTLKMPFLCCPSSGAQLPGGNSYVANCGIPDGVAKRDASGVYTSGDLSRFNGVFTDGATARHAGAVAMSDIADGLTNTMLFSENLQTGRIWDITEYENGFCWAVSDNKIVVNTTIGCKYLETAGESSIVPYGSSPYSIVFRTSRGNGFFISAGKGSYLNIGGYKGFNKVKEPPLPINRCRADLSGPRAWTTARPSSEHPGVVIVSMADGSVRSISQDVDITTFAAAMTPRDMKSAGATAFRRQFSAAGSLD